MRKKLVMLVVLGLVVLCSFARAERIVLNVDEDRKQMEMYGYPVGTFAFLTTSNSNSFKLDTTCYQLVVQTNTVLWGTKQNTITFDSWTLRIGEVKRQIDNARVPGLRTEIIADCVNGDTVNLYLRLFVLGNTASIQIIPKAETGAETVLGLTGGYTIVYATPPNFAPTVGGSPVSSGNPMPVSGSTSQSNTDVLRPADWKVYAFTFYDTTASGTVTFTGVLKSVGFTSGGAVTDSATIYINGVQYDCLLGGEDSGEGFEGLLTNPVISWVLNGVTRLRIKLSGYLP